MLATLRLIIFATIFVAIQVWILGYARLLGWATPFIYPALLVLIPMHFKPIPLALLGAVVGAVLDALMLTPGLHMASFTLVCFLRYYLLQQFIDQNTNLTLLPSYPVLRGASILLYAEALLIHHIVLYGLNIAFSFDWDQLLKSFAIGYLASLTLGVMVLLSLGIGNRANG